MRSQWGINPGCKRLCVCVWPFEWEIAPTVTGVWILGSQLVALGRLRRCGLVEGIMSPEAGFTTLKTCAILRLIALLLGNSQLLLQPPGLCSSVMDSNSLETYVRSSTFFCKLLWSWRIVVTIEELLLRYGTGGKERENVSPVPWPGA